MAGGVKLAERRVVCKSDTLVQDLTLEPGPIAVHSTKCYKQPEETERGDLQNALVPSVGSQARSVHPQPLQRCAKKLAEHLLSMTTQAIGKATLAGELVEVDCDAKDKVGDSRGGP